jgi:excinuclease ABC subunit B
MPKFELVSDYVPRGDQPQAIEKLTEGLKKGHKYQTLLGVTGSGKTFTMANIIANVQRPTLVISHNKTLAAQLYSEFREFFPKNAVHYFVSFYDWYIPEAYIPQTDTYIEKDTRINEEIDRLRMAATASLMSRRDVIIVASVSCIYGIGSPEQFAAQRVQLKVGDIVKRNDILRALVDIRYQRNDIDFSRGRFRARGDVIEVFPAYSETAYRIELFGDEVDRITEINTLTGEILNEYNEIEIFPARHFMTDEERFEQALLDVETELQERIGYFVSENKLLEAQRIEQRTRFDLEMMREVGYCMGIENYSRHLSGLKPGEPPYCLMNFYPDDFLLFIDESHVTIPQVRGMYRGDRSRKQTLVDYGFRLPSALDNRPLQYEEFEKVISQAIFVSATPAEFERELSMQHGQIAEQIIRPTGLIDPKISVHPTEGQIDHLIGEINKRIEKKQRVLVLTMTKRMAEDLTDYLQDAGIRTTYLHSDIETLERPQILRDLREAKFDVLVGINLLREGLDLPEVTLVAILDADRQGFLRSETSLIQMAGRAARNVDGEVILYANDVTDAIRNAMRETERRRQIQMEYNEKHGITPASIQKAIIDMLPSAAEESSLRYSPFTDRSILRLSEAEASAGMLDTMPHEDLQKIIDSLSQEMQEAAANLEFERAAALRDQIMELKKELEG